MRIATIEHVAFEGPASVAAWATQRGHSLSRTPIFRDGERLPTLGDFDALVVLGGPMNVYEFDKHPWLRAETELIGEAIAAGRMVVGVCLGAQLMSVALGGKVTRNHHHEIGWFDVNLTAEGQALAAFDGFPAAFPAFHWHGDTFEIPAGAVRAASSEACVNQAFVYGDRAVALQFHLESTPQSVNLLIENCADELTEGRYIQRPEPMRSDDGRFARINRLMTRLLDNLEKQ
ncbi:MAG: type 1 glutamine amidotransferase [Phycisphaerae bacterium]|nr:type 1 glutamine amidotransferase [Phycisphaerae bacterium]